MNKKTVFVALAILIAVVAVLIGISLASGTGTTTSVAISAGFVVFAGIIGLGPVYTGLGKAYDERMLKARSDAAFLAFLVTLMLIMCAGFISNTSDGAFPLSLYATSMVCAMTGISTFVILADMQDAYLSISQKRFVNSISFFFLGLVMIFTSGVGTDRVINLDRTATLLAMGIGWTAIGLEMFIKSAADRKAASVEEADEESEA